MIIKYDRHAVSCNALQLTVLVKITKRAMIVLLISENKADETSTQPD